MGTEEDIEMKYLSICSGIEAATVAWASLHWEPVAFAEIDAFPSAVLKHRFPSVLNLGDISKIDWESYHGKIDLVVGGTPCQSFSIAGDRTGLNGASGLVYQYFRLLEECKPRWFIWENVPGVLSSNRGKDFQSILRAWNDCGYGVAWRVLDSQFFGVPQRRKRVFAVGYFGDWKAPTKVLFDGEQINAVLHPRKAGGGHLPSIKRTDGGLTLERLSQVVFTATEGMRKLTPLECERLFGFPDGWTDIPWRGKDHAPDGLRYKALGNSMCVNTIKWLGQRIERVEAGK